MKFECEYDPNILIEEIGDRYFILENQGRIENIRVIVDCEDEVRIEISSSYGKTETYKIAVKLLKLLNQEYSKVGE